MKNKQIIQFYLASFFKNQLYFTPILILFFLDSGLNYKEVFWIFTIASTFSFLIEIPTGIFADFYGKRSSIILSKFFVFISFLLFGFSKSFLFFIIAQLIYELGKAFKSGTETAYIYDYLDSDKNTSKIKYTEVKGKQKFYARISESASAFFAGFLAIHFGYNFIFFISAIPAFLNFIFSLFWMDLKEEKIKISLKESFSFIKLSFKEIYENKEIIRLIINISIFSSIIMSLDKFIQPYMQDVGINLEYIGVIYSIILFIGAIIVRYSHVLEDRFGQAKTINFLSIFALLPLLILGFGYHSVFGVALFFLVIIVANVRSPIINSLFHSYVGSRNRATMGSILELFQSSAKLIVLPIIGYVADIIDVKTAILLLSIFLCFNIFLFYISKKDISY